MAETLLISVREAHVTFGGAPLFDGLEMHIQERDRIALVGKNGAGKTTLMKLISGDRELDGGERWQLPGSTVGYMEQEVQPTAGQKVREYVFAGLPAAEQSADNSYLVEQVVLPLGLNPESDMGLLSGGQVRRASLARALIEAPDLLMLDEPTNHLDLEVIEWLEQYLRGYRGALLCVSHDRRFLANISSKVFWLDRGQVRVCPYGYGRFEEWQDEQLDLERRELENRAAKVSQEMEWANRGVKARRKRNQARLANIHAARQKLKQDQSSYRAITKTIHIEPPAPESNSRLVAEFYNVHKSFELPDGSKLPILDGMFLRIQRGERYGILGANGSGKTTFLKLLTGSLEQDIGSIKVNKNLNISYFDQNRSTLKPDWSIKRNFIPDGGDYLTVGGKERHICGYLKDFLFDPKQVNTLAGHLSGGQKNRLMLAKVLADPGDLLILDEPTNDLDMDTLDMLEDTLARYQGTLFIVSHDRDFIDQTVSQILVFEGEGKVERIVGGWDDYELWRAKQRSGGTSKKEESSTKQDVKAEAKAAKKEASLTFTEEHRLKKIPKEMEALEAEMSAMTVELDDAQLYVRDPDRFDALTKGFGKKKAELAKLEEEWLELEAKREAS